MGNYNLLKFSELKYKIESIWWSLENNYDTFPYRYSKKKDKELIQMKNYLAEEMNRYNDGESTKENSDDILNKVQAFMIETLDISRKSVDHVIREQYIECSREFVERAKEFDKNITSESVFQALRNIWTINSMQLYLNYEVKLTDAMFAYSMLYPLTDNFLDDKNLSKEYKIEFNKRFRNKILTGDGIGKSDQEERIFYMIDLIEKDYPREEFPEVYDALIAIQDGQSMSIRQHGLSGIYNEDIMGISIYKGGSSVLADGYLVCGQLNEADQLFAFAYGVILQLADDFQDIKEDLANKHYTMMNVQTKFGKLDNLINKYCNFIDYFFKEIFQEEGEQREALKEVIAESIQLLKFGATIKNKRNISRNLYKKIINSNFFSPRVYTKVEKGVDTQLEALMTKQMGEATNMNYSITRKNDFNTSEWSGGTTTQLMIYPPDSLYSERNFKWRLSSAKVEIAESTFTNLPGIWRKIMVIEGELKLEHKGHHKVHLKPFQQDSFSGEYETRRFGKVTDFNLMMGKGCNGNLDYITLNNGESKNITFTSEKEEEIKEITEVFYCVNGEIEILTEKDERIKLFQGDLISVSRNAKENLLTFNFTNNLEKEVKIIKAVVNY